MTEIRFSGFGGQGIVLAGYILGKALTIYDGLEAVMTQSYGPEARGGASSANIMVSDEPIDYPIVQRPDILVALSQEAYTRFRPTAKAGAIILIDEDLVKPTDHEGHHAIPATHLAEGLGRRIVTNVVMLGFFTAVTGVVSREVVVAFDRPRDGVYDSDDPQVMSRHIGQARSAGLSGFAVHWFAPDDRTDRLAERARSMACSRVRERTAGELPAAVFRRGGWVPA